MSADGNGANQARDGHVEVTDSQVVDARARAEDAATTATAPATTALRDVAAEPGVGKPEPILVADHVRRTFGGLTAVDVAHLEVQRGTITALIGPNGAGKTTLFNLLTGFDRADAGTWRFQGRRISRLAAYQVARRGMVRTFQLTKSLTRLTVMENMKLAAVDQPGESFAGALLWWRWQRHQAAIEKRANELLERFQLHHMRGEYAGTLSGGQRKLLEMARALMVNPALVMLDEPMAGVNPALTETLLAHVQEVRDEGTTVVFVEHDMDVVMGISDWIVCLAQGQVIAEGAPQQIRADAAVIDAYLGTRHDEPVREGE